jgi:hypothetical protein
MNARKPMVAVLASLGVFVGACSLWSAPALAHEACPNEASRQGPSATLPECRVYEQVTPVDKGGALDLYPFTEVSLGPTGIGGVFPANNNISYVAEDGNALLLNSPSSIGPSAPSGQAAYVFSRGAEGWNMTVAIPPLDEEQLVEVEVYDPIDLSAVGLRDQIGSAASLYGGDESGFQTGHYVGPAAGPFSTASLLSGQAGVRESEEVVLVGGSADLSHVILESQNHALAPGAEGQVKGTNALYESTGGECAPGTSNCALVNVGPEGKPLSCGAVLGQGETRYGGAYSAVSSDGSQVIFTAPDPGGSFRRAPQGPGCWNPGGGSQENPPQLYMREDGSRTVEISAPEAGVEVGVPGNPLQPVVFVGASSDGSKVFFVTGELLTKERRGGLYEYETATGKLTPFAEGVDFVAGVSSDGSAVYFSSWAQLAPGASALSPGYTNHNPVNLYRYDTVTGVTTFITTVNQGDYQPSTGVSGSWYGEPEHTGLSHDKEWFVTGNGQFLVFPSLRQITGFDNYPSPGTPLCEPIYYFEGLGPCEELYRYDANAAEEREPSIVCVSCFGVPGGNATFDLGPFHSADSEPIRPISEDGREVFFNSQGALVPQATPGKLHVYEWHEGKISMISSPADPNDDVFLGMGADGRDAFFVTHAQLAPRDTDNSTDVYDARVDGGFAGITPAQCTGTGCQGIPAAPPIFATPASVTFEGVGNFATGAQSSGPPPSEPAAKPKSCKRGFLERRDRCVKKKAKKTKRSAKGRK